MDVFGYKDTPVPLTFATVMNFWGYPEVWERMKEMGVDEVFRGGSLTESIVSYIRDNVRR